MSTVIESIKSSKGGSLGGKIKITNEIKMDSKILYLIRVNGEEQMFLNSEEEAKLAIDSLAAELYNELLNHSTEVYRADIPNGDKITLSIRDLGTLYNSSIYQVMVIDFLPVGQAFITKGRHELSEPVGI